MAHRGEIRKNAAVAAADRLVLAPDLVIRSGGCWVPRRRERGKRMLQRTERRCVVGCLLHHRRGVDGAEDSTASAGECGGEATAGERD
uniref:Uncharacterized protein n=1 Tax=Oryza meridionalis TaxID=40149 RepID=A0A0E0ESD1_9ORYZ